MQNILQVPIFSVACYYNERTFASGQWWTVKSVDKPYLGCPIQYGDKIFLENHTFLDILQVVPGRLALAGGDLFKKTITCKSILEEGSDQNYWILEKAFEKI